MHFTLSDLVLDVAQNAAEAQSRRVRVQIEETEKRFYFSVQDDGKGMDRESLQRALDPFYTDGTKHPGRKVGLGLPFLVQTAEQSGGGWNVQSEPGKGTIVEGWFDLENVDCPPVGDIPGLIRTILLLPGPEEWILYRSLVRQGRRIEYEVRRSELENVLGNLEEGENLILLDQYLRSQETEQ